MSPELCFGVPSIAIPGVAARVDVDVQKCRPGWLVGGIMCTSFHATQFCFTATVQHTLDLHLLRRGSTVTGACRMLPIMAAGLARLNGP